MAEEWAWPNGARAAVSLTYDDGNENNLDQAMPDLEAADFRGTFYLQVSRPEVHRRADDWRAAHERGHEIGNHTLHHPCRADVYLRKHGEVPSWLTRPLEGYTPTQIAAEVAEAADWLDHRIGPDADRTFAYPCGAVAIGDPPDEASYDNAVLRRHPAARATQREVNDPLSVKMLRIGAFGAHGDDPAPLIAPCEQALVSGGWTVLVFHGVGGPSHTTGRAAHQALIDHLRAGPYWVAPLKAVAAYVKSRRR